MSQAEDLLRQGQPDAALAALTEQVKKAPGDSKLRVFLSQLLSVNGAWERAVTQVKTAAELDAAAIPMRQMMTDAINCETIRNDVFAGRRSPMVFGEPEEWLAFLIESLLQAGAGQHALADDLNARALEAAPASSGTVDGVPFQWIADADSRLGPVLEAIINGRYYWVPYSRLAEINTEKPSDLRDLIWLPARLAFTNGGEAFALLPVRYPGTEKLEDGALRLSRRTEWKESRPGKFQGLGQRLVCTDASEAGLLEIRSIVFDAVEATEGDVAEGNADAAPQDTPEA